MDKFYFFFCSEYCYYPCFSDEDMEAQGVSITFPRWDRGGGGDQSEALSAAGGPWALPALSSSFLAEAQSQPITT